MLPRPSPPEPQIVYVERSAGCAPSCTCCLALLLATLFGCALLTWFGLVALGWR